MFRIQKLLLSEFKDIYEPVIVENPFTQVDPHGIGLRQYHIGLTPKRIIFACDTFDVTCLDQFGYRTVDLEIETMNLVSLIPLEMLKFNFIRKNGRELMIIRFFQNEKVSLTLEFGGHIHKNLHWNIWRERIARIKLFQPYYDSITGASPFSSTDEVNDEFKTQAIVHRDAKSSTCTSMSVAMRS